MERRKILLGSGAALATVLAGCSSDETGDDSDSNDDDESLNDGDDGSDETDDKTEIPGLDRDKLNVDSDKLSIKDVNKDDDTVDVVATTTTTDPETLRTELQSLGETIAAAITDSEKFAAEVNSVTWVLESDGAKVMSFYVDVQWALAYINDEMSEDEFVETVLETSDDT
ncbi:hypothetical protein [Natrinema versiforme]|uniref:DUF8159 domain-containing protein n=1 Tax=Natrinema versiforme JCM 10478 TaxID=1227496 RepID=L9Y305_9EURY|nr:hypothetical protein [Natrinema versiforme]ELY68082.1 hypothetical protein C489_08760 [Natrinema versiforme JCM 10478]